MKTFLNIVLVIGYTIFSGLILIPLELSIDEWFSISCLLGVFAAKMEINKTDLENKIFELKELIEKQNKV